MFHMEDLGTLWQRVWSFFFFVIRISESTVTQSDRVGLHKDFVSPPYSFARS